MGFSHVLITRPEPEAGQLAERFAAGPLRAIVMPAFAFESRGTRFARGFASSTARRLAVFTSTRAVQFGLPQLPEGYLDGAEIAAIGPATARALEKAGFPVMLIPRGGYTSEAFLADQDLARAPGLALIFAAPGGRDALRRGLTRLGWQVRAAYVYQRVACDPPKDGVSALKEADRIVSIWTSGNAMEALAACLPAAAWDRVLQGDGVVISPRLGELARKRGIRRVHLAEGPDNDRLYAAVMKLT